MQNGSHIQPIMTSSTTSTSSSQLNASIQKDFNLNNSNPYNYNYSYNPNPNTNANTNFTSNPASNPPTIPQCNHYEKHIGNPFPVTKLSKRINRAAKVISEYLSTPQEQVIIPESTIQNCKGLVFLSVIKGGYIWSGRIGSGLVITRLEDGRWSAPSAISCLGVGYGAQCGLEFTDVVMILRDENAVNAFMQLGNVTIGANVGLALGPWGRSAEFGFAATCALTYAFSKTKGLFGGLSLEGTIFFENRKTNEKFYGKGATARKILNGLISHPEVAILHNALEARFPSHPASVPSVAAAAAAAAAASYQPMAKDVNYPNVGVSYPGVPAAQNDNNGRSETLPAYQNVDNVVNTDGDVNAEGFVNLNNEKERLLNQ